jgi:hypothetical protein
MMVESHEFLRQTYEAGKRRKDHLVRKVNENISVLRVTVALTEYN